VSLFHHRLLKKYLKQISNIPEAHAQIAKQWADNLARGIYDSETQNDSEFIQQILINLLGYSGSSAGKEWTVAKNQPIGRGNVDVALGQFSADNSQILAVLELKGAKTKDLNQIMPGRGKSPVRQAFEYASDNKGTQWILVCNYREIRLYAHGYGSTDYEYFDLSRLTKPLEYARFILLLSADNLLGGKTKALLEESEQIEKDITDELYQDYKALRTELIQSIAVDNPDKSKLQVIRYTQTILDRILFIAFAEDKGLLADKTLEKAFTSSNPFNPQPVWENFKGLFKAIDKGNEALKIPAYNGGLFAENQDIDNLQISDVLCEGFKKIGEYDFDSDISVNILGHIFEQSINDLEELKGEAQNNSHFERKKGRRKKEGIFYTPAYITRYIVEQAVGGWLNEKRKALGFDQLPVLTDKDYASIRITGKRKVRQQYNEQIAAHIQFWQQYKQAVSSIKVLDPACGSGAFLNEVFDFLKNEGEQINQQLTGLTGQHELFRWDTHILANNLYGVDLNRESVEITKLSLWLKTANRQEKLTYLQDNIKVGNSLIDDPAVAGELAFNWEKEFPAIMASGGFDVVVGNPPYVFARNQNFSLAEKEHYSKNYQQGKYQINTYSLFIEKGYSLIKQNGFFGYIIPNTWLSNSSFFELRQFILQNTGKTSILNVNDDAFSDANVDCCILLFSKALSDEKLFKGYLSKEKIQREEILKSILDSESAIINLSISNSSNELLKKINKNSIKLEDIAQVTTGLKAYQENKGKPKQSEKEKKERVFHSTEKQDYTYIKYLEGRDVQRYFCDWSGEYLSYGDWLAEPRKSVNFEQPRILVRQIPSKPPYSIEAALILEPALNDINSMIVVASINLLEQILPILNSRLTSWWFIQTFDKFQRKTFPQFRVGELKTFPFPVQTDGLELLAGKATEISKYRLDIVIQQTHFTDLLDVQFPSDKKTPKLSALTNYTEESFLAFLEKYNRPNKLSLAQKSEWLQHFKSEQTKALELQKEINCLDKEIDQMVYRLYQLNEEEIALIEQGQP